ncbi:MAG: hypothetical protein JRE47_12615 [Deltaproteobacteria bacterium]|nr:hypothetical protein [Deltaproteobacteria bacterium]
MAISLIEQTGSSIVNRHRITLFICSPHEQSGLATRFDEIRELGRRAPRFISIMILLALLLLSLASCGPQLKSVRVLPIKPISHTPIECYPTIENVYQSDDEIFLVSSWHESTPTGSHLIKWRIYNDKGESVAETEESYVTLRPLIFLFNRISLSEAFKEKTPFGNYYSVHLYVDDKLMASQRVGFLNESIVNPHLQSAVVLPFQFTPGSHIKNKVVLVTATNAVYGEVRRIIKGAVPPAVTENQIGNDFAKKNFASEDQINIMAEIFNEDILIAGNVSFPKSIGEESILTVLVLYKKTGRIKKFTASDYGGKGKYALVLSDLIRKVLYEEGLLEYLRKL